MNRTTLLIPLALLLAGLLAWLLFFWEPASAPSSSGRPATSSTTPPAAEFKLNSLQGPLRLSDFRGKVVVLYFGYTYCPDICPTSLALLGQALSTLDAPTLNQVQGIFISVDPARDTPERLAEYAQFFHPGLLGATASATEVARLAEAYEVGYVLQPPNSEGNYAVDHTSVTYLINPQGQLAAKLPHETPPAEIAAAIRRLLPG